MFDHRSYFYSQVAKLANLVYNADKDFQILSGSVSFMYPAMTVGNDLILFSGIVFFFPFGNMFYTFTILRTRNVEWKQFHSHILPVDGY